MDPSDGEVVRGVLRGETARYEVLVRRYEDSLYRRARAMLGDSDVAADVVQDSFVKAYTRLHTCDPERFGAWIHRIARNRCTDWLKSRRRRDLPLLPDAPYPTPSADEPGTALERAETARAVAKALGHLPPAQREAFLLKHVDGLSYEEMAELLGAGISAMKMRVMRAREALRAHLGERV